MQVVIKPYNTTNNMQRSSQRKHYDFDSIENFIRCKGYPESINDRVEKSKVRIHKYFFCTI